MAEMVSAILVVCIPALKSLVKRGIEASSSNRGTNQAGSSSTGYKAYASGSSHIKLSAGRDVYVTSTNVVVPGDDSGSEVELNNLQRKDVIYKSDRISVTYQQRDDIRP
jgi:hypothetical protein